jgi:hypothetical protein
MLILQFWLKLLYSTYQMYNTVVHTVVILFVCGYDLRIYKSPLQFFCDHHLFFLDSNWIPSCKIYDTFLILCIFGILLMFYTLLLLLYLTNFICIFRILLISYRQGRIYAWATGARAHGGKFPGAAY